MSSVEPPIPEGSPVDANYWVQGGCAEYALAMHDRDPSLRFGRHIEEMPDEYDPEWDSAPPFATNHVFVHDDTHAYDARGQHPLPYDDTNPVWAENPANVKTQYDVPRADIEGEWENDPAMIDEAHRWRDYFDAYERHQSRTASVPEDFKSLLPKTAKDSRPFKYLWVFDPESDRVHIDFTPKDKPAHFPLHHEMVQKHGVHHPEHQKGWAIAIVNGWRIFTTDLKRPDPYVKRKVEEALEGKHPLPSLPHVRYHGDPQRKAQ